MLDPHAAAGGVAILDSSTAVVAEWQVGKVLQIDLKKGGAGAYLTGFKNPLPLLSIGSGRLLVGDWGSGVVYEITKR